MGKMKMNIPMLAALILLLLTMVTTHFTSGLYARYVSHVTATDSARVAKFDVKGTLSGDVKVDCKSNEGGTFTISVQNQSEVSIGYDVDVVFKESLQEALDSKKLEVTLDGKTGVWNEAERTLSFKEVGVLAPLTDTAAPHHVLTFLVKDHTYVTSTGEGEEITKALAFKVNIHAGQID